MSKRIYYGGQAVIEGVMMRGAKAMVIAVRRPNGELTLDVRRLGGLYTSKWRTIPLARGIIVLIESLVLGIQMLLFSANVAVEEEEEEISSWAIFGMLVFSFAVAIGLFFMAPLFLTRLIDQFIESAVVFNVIEGIVRLAIFLLYLKLVSLMPDIRRVFEYHGAEHKTVNAYEAGVPLEVDHIKNYSTAHVRCGTSFLFIVMIIAIIVFALVGLPALWLMVLSRVVLIPVIAALGYEVTNFAGKHTSNSLVRAILAPGLWLQSLTTREPDESQIEAALTALKKAIEIDRGETDIKPEPSAA